MKADDTAEPLPTSPPPPAAVATSAAAGHTVPPPAPMTLLQRIRALLTLVLAIPLTVLASAGAWLSVVVLRWSPSRATIFPTLWARAICRAAGVSVRIEGAEHLQPYSTYIFAANHASQFDIFSFQGYFPHQFRWIAKKELFRIPIFGPALRRVGAIAIDRGHGREALKSLDRAAQTIASGTSVLIFPEGTRSPDGLLHEFKTGGTLLALRAGVPVVPVAFIGTRAILPKGSWLARSGRIVIRVGLPINPVACGLRHKQALASLLHKEVALLMQQNEKT